MNDVDQKFEKLYGTYYKAILAYFVRVGFSRMEADEHTQETFMRVYRIMKRDGIDPNWTYLATTAHHVAANHFKRGGRQIKAEIRISDEELEALVGSVASPEQQASAAEGSARLRRAIDQLPVRMGQALLLRLGGRSYREIAGIQGITEQTVKSTLRDATALLRRLLRGEDDHGQQG